VQARHFGRANHENLVGFVQDFDRELFQDAGQIEANCLVVAARELQQIADLNRVDPEAWHQSSGGKHI